MADSDTSRTPASPCQHGDLRMVGPAPERGERLIALRHSSLVRLRAALDAGVAGAAR